MTQEMGDGKWISKNFAVLAFVIVEVLLGCSDASTLPVPPTVTADRVVYYRT